MKIFSVQLFVETDDNSEDGGFIEKVLEDSFDSYDGYLTSNVSATLIDETEDEQFTINNIIDFNEWPGIPEQNI